ncbi:MAG: UxaA family hydrolase [Burkholderiaceae bacterium]
MSEQTDALLLLSPDDNVLIARRRIAIGETVVIDGRPFTVAEPIALGHKLARVAIAAGAKVLKYGAPIGVATEAVAAGRHLHVHNMRSDYTPSVVLAETGAGGTDGSER